MKKSSVSRSLAAVLASTLLLAACGGGGGGGKIGDTPVVSAVHSYEGVAPAAPLPTQRNFLRTYLDEVYLWYREIVEVDPNQYTTAADYFLALLRTPDVNGLPKDRFSRPIVAAANIVSRSFVAQQSIDPTLLASHTPYGADRETQPLGAEGGLH